MTFTPQIDGSLPIQSAPAQFVPAFERRAAAGLLTGAAHRRSNYRVLSSGPDGIRVTAADWRTAFNVGLNDVELRFPLPGTVHYTVRYWRWAGYGIGLCGAVGITGLVLLLGFDARGYFARNPAATLPGLSVDQSLGIAWAMAIFWGFGWPWILIALHKRPLHRLIARLVAEVDAAVSTC
jgi:hypothetical protein